MQMLYLTVKVELLLSRHNYHSEWRFIILQAFCYMGASKVISQLVKYRIDNPGGGGGGSAVQI